jgi:hypothetical protein
MTVGTDAIAGLNRDWRLRLAAFARLAELQRVSAAMWSDLPLSRRDSNSKASESGFPRRDDPDLRFLRSRPRTRLEDIP